MRGSRESRVRVQAVVAYRDSILNWRAFHFLLNVVHEDAAELLHVMLKVNVESFGLAALRC